MDQSSIEVLITVAEEGSFRKAANQLGYTQAGISYIVQNVEQEMGLRLFDRDRSGVRLSAEGRQLMPELKQLKSYNRILQQKIKELKGLESGTLRVQVFDSVSIHWIPGIIQSFKADFPGITIDLVSEEDNLKAEEMVLTGEVDCGFFLTDVTAPIDVVPLREESIKAIVSLDHELAECECFPTSRLGEFPFVQLKFDTNTGINGIFDRYGVEADVAYTVDNDFAAMALVSKGLGFGIYPELLLENIPFDVKCLEFDEPQRRVISIGTRSMKNASRAAVKFIEYTKQWILDNVEGSLLEKR